MSVSHTHITKMPETVFFKDSDYRVITVFIIITVFIFITVQAQKRRLELRWLPFQIFAYTAFWILGSLVHNPQWPETSQKQAVNNDTVPE